MSALFDRALACVAVSEQFIAGLDRTPLGSFAIPYETLRAMDVYQRVSIIVNNDIDRFDMDVKVLWDSLADRVELLCGETGTDRSTAICEMLFWLYFCNDESRSDAHNVRMTIAHQGGVDRLLMVYENPSMHGYFEVDLWNEDFIAHCIADDIDPEMALSLSRVVAE